MDYHGFCHRKNSSGLDVLGKIYEGPYQAGEEVIRQKDRLSFVRRQWVNQMITHVLHIEQDHQSSAYQRARYVQGPDTFAGYIVKETIYRGGYTAVYLVEKNGQRFVLKRFLSGIDLDSRIQGSKDDNLRLFLKDAEMLKRLSSQDNTEEVSRYVPKLRESGKQEGDDYFIMDVIKGQTMTSYMNNHPDLNVVDRMKLMRKILVAVSALHRAGYGHFDLKLLNIMITESGEVKLIDFETAEVLGESFPILCSRKEQEDFVHQNNFFWI